MANKNENAEKEYTTTVTGVCLDEKGSMFNAVVFYNGESFYSYLMTESDISSADNESKELYGKPVGLPVSSGVEQANFTLLMAMVTCTSM